jgi:hypothetical protein
MSTKEEYALKKILALALALLIFLLLTACANLTLEAPQRSDNTGDAQQTSPRTKSAKPVSVGSGSFEPESSKQLLPEQQALILQYMDRYYDSLATLEAQNPADLFADDAYTQSIANRTVWEYVIGIRSMQQTDLSLVSYRYELILQEVSPQDDGSVQIILIENSTQNFTSHPDVASELYDIRHIFSLKDTDRGWRISRHFQRDTLYWMVMEDYVRQDFLTTTASQQYFAIKQKELLANAKHYADLRRTQGVQQSDISIDHEYNRAAAVSYATEWVGKRNNEWTDYSGLGGNCQNFTSQCLLAGGIPMDTSGVSWYWYSDSKREPAWTGVEYFLSYAQNNAGYGLVATADVPYYRGEVGDILMMGTSDDQEWQHTVMITDVITDENGDTVDYLVSSNTADLKNFPASAYAYTMQMLINIHGWND